VWGEGLRRRPSPRAADNTNRNSLAVDHTEARLVERVKGRALEILRDVLLAALAPFPEAREAVCLAFLEFDARAAHLVST
jgi:hypothetical protein